jgi:hypothetical protein
MVAAAAAATLHRIAIRTREMSDTLPCGCILDIVGAAFVMQPCSPDCEYYRYALDRMTEQGKPIRYMVDPAAAFRCPRCGTVSHHPTDVIEGYCGRCHDWTGRR